MPGDEIPLEEFDRLHRHDERNGSKIPPPQLEVADARPPEFTDEALALRFAEKHQTELRYVAVWGKWLQWDGTRWRLEDTLRAFDLSRAVCRVASSQVSSRQKKVAAKLASATTVAAIERLAKADRRLAATVGQWDTDTWALNSPDGVIDLRTGKSRAHRPDDYMTKITAVSPGGDCPIWYAFLDRITAGDVELQRFLQRVLGYALTGSTIAHALFFLYGTGGNGKGVFLNTVTAILGDYASVASIETFTASTSERHPTDLAMLRGARIVTAQETEEGRRWAESRIKALTGGDPITARFMRQDFFTFTPQFKLVIAGNHRPALRNVDEAIRRRMYLIPFVVTISAEERDENLSEKLKAEWPGILQWMIDGCLDWQTEQLSPPEAVRGATAEYLAAEDATALWVDECCSVRPANYSTTAELFQSWTAWATKTGEYVGSMKRFSQKLAERGFQPERNGPGKAGFRGINVAPAASPEGDYADR